MIRNYLKIALRNFWKNKGYSSINIFGLAIGMSICLLMVLFVQDEFKYDRFFKNAERIYQVNVSANFDGDEFVTGNTPPPVGKILANEFPEIESYTRIFRPREIIVSHKENGKTVNYFSETGVLAVDSTFLQVFSFPVVTGNSANCLNDPNAVVITEKMAEKYFGKEAAKNPLGEILFLNNQPFKVTGVLYDVPSQSSLQFDFLTSIHSQPSVKRFNWSWVWLQVATYVKVSDKVLNDDEAIRKLEAKFPAMVKIHAADAFRRIGKPFEEFLEKGGKWDLLLQPMTGVHLYSADIGGRINNLGDIKQVYMFSIIALFVMLLACVNFMNLSTARSVKRVKEVGVRKVLGSGRGSLIWQFLTESFMYSFGAAILGIFLVSAFLPIFNQIVGKNFDLSLLFSNDIILWTIILILTTGFLAGSYPALYLTSFDPAKVLKSGLLKTGLANLLVRNGLVIFQFSVSIILIIGTIVVFEQLEFTRNKDLGLTKENLLVLPNAVYLGEKGEAFRQEVAKFPEVMNAAISTTIPTTVTFQDTYVPEPTITDNQVTKEISLESYIVDDDFASTLGIKLDAGRDFSKDFADSSSVILNQAAVKAIGWKDPIGKLMNYPGNNNQRFKVIGVVKDFNTESLRSLVPPLALFHNSSKTYTMSTSYLVVRIRTGEVTNLLAKLENKWKAFAPETPFKYTFLDQEFEALYNSEKKTRSIFSIFTGLAIFIACLGLFALAAYTAETKTKEIGIRKVLGASVISITALLSKDFLKLVLYSFVIAAPLAWYFMYAWLKDFAYKTDLHWWIFAIAGLGSMLIAVITVSYQATRAALMNPIKSLKTE